jgi:MtfA peptidase
MEAIISAGASHMVFNLPAESLTFFERIIVYPDDYESKITRKKHRGEVNPGMRLIVFSWKGIQAGLKREEGINLLIHEFAHALWLEHKLQSHLYTVLDLAFVQKFEELAHAEMERLSTNEQHFFRKYAFENLEEFFAVAVENFFERPEQLNDAMPHFYDVCTYLFKQNPIQQKSFHQ